MSEPTRLDGVWVVEDLTVRGGVVTGRVPMSPDLPYFEGHFPGAPLLPGAAQLALVLAFIERALEAPVEPGRIRRTKFTGRIHPGNLVTVRVEIDSAAGRARWRLSEARRDVSTGDLCFEAGT